MKDFDKSTILLFIVLMLLLASSIYVYINKVLIPTNNNNKVIAQYESNKKAEQQEEEPVEEEKTLTEEEIKLNLKSTAEVDRIRTYFSEYIDYVDQKEYDKAYACLYEEFKNNYFPEQAKFQEYIDKTYPEYMGIEYTDISRQGNYYILTVNIYDALEDNVTTYLEQKFVINENDFGNFVLSFQVQE